MMIELTLDDGGFQKALRQLATKDVAIAATWAINDTAADVLGKVQANVRERFDRPTRFTQNAFAVVKKARPNELEAVVGERPSVSQRHYLKVQERGGQRGMTGTEKLISLATPTNMDIRGVLPADEAKLDAFGNWSSGERNRALSAIRAQRDVTANTTIASKKRHKTRATYFIPRTGLTPGIYRKDSTGAIGIVAVFTSKVPTYRRRLGFMDGAEEAYRTRLPLHLRRTLARMAEKRGLGPSGPDSARG
ncbi:hypothetical protein CDV50_16060 [Haematobacter massiliensis]|nr:hypothetical protein CDV50_16060 [Haematobacter massiliensis]